MTIDTCNFQCLIDPIEMANKDRLNTIKLHDYYVSYIIR